MPAKRASTPSKAHPRSKGARGSARHPTPVPRRSKLPTTEPDAPSIPTTPEAPTPAAPPTQVATPLAATEPAPLPGIGAPTGPETTTGAGPDTDPVSGNPAEEKTDAESEENEEGEADGLEGPSAAEVRPARPKGVAPELPLRVEALLFAASKPVSVHDLVGSLGDGADHVAVHRALRKLQRAYANRNTSLEVRKAGDAWALQVREEYLPVAHTVTPVDIPGHSLRVLALIAFHQPIRQSVLARMVGEAAYSEVKSLKDLSFIHAVPKASTLELTTTSYFAQYFGLESTDKQKIRERLAQKLGIPLSAIPPAPTEDPAVDGATPSLPPDPSSTSADGPGTNGERPLPAE